MLSETIRRTRMYSGITQSQMARELFISESSYSRKENGQMDFERHEALKMAKILDLNEELVMKYWMADKLYELMKTDRVIVYDALKIVEANFDNYESCIEIPKYNSSFSSLNERNLNKKKKI